MGDRVVVRRQGERLIIEGRPPGPLAIAFVWGATALMGTIGFLMARVLESWVLLAPGLLLLLLFAFAFPRQGWRVDVSSRVLTLTRDGPLGGSRRSWPAEGVSAVWLEGRRSDDIDVWSCRVRFEDGTLEDLLSGEEADMRRLVDMLRNRPREKPRVIGTCRVCGAGMSRRIVSCARCRTPHHAECWTYVGQCSTYGCREVLTFEPDWNVNT